jgi:hypothetical protein
MTKKYFIMLPVLLFFAVTVRSQTIVQLTEQLDLDIQKLAGLKTILQDMYKDYEAINKGYTAIRDISEGNFNLHSNFLNGLLLVSPVIRGCPRIIDVVNAEFSIVSEYKAALSRFRADKHFTMQELDDIGSIYASLLQKSLQSVDELAMVITDGQLRMTDAQRLQAIDQVYSAIMQQLSRLRQFNSRTALLAIQRLKESNDAETLKTIYGITH